MKKSRRLKKTRIKAGWKHDIKVFQCYICPVCGKRGTDESMNIHHCRNRCKGGRSTKENCVAVHKLCHKWIHDTFGNKYYDPRNTIHHDNSEI